MAEKIVEVQAGNSLKIIHEILISQGITRRTTIKGNMLQAVGEAGIGIFFIGREGDNKLKIEARNEQALEIIANLVIVGLKDRGTEEVTTISQEKKDLSCSLCNVPLEEIAKKELWDEIPVRVMICPKCNRLEFFKI